MPAFTYIALDSAGHKHKGVLEGDSLRQIRQSLRERSWVPLSVELAQQGKKTKGSFARKKQSLSASQLILFTYQLSTLLEAGMPMEAGLQAIARQSEKRNMQSLVLSVRASICEGNSLARALGEFPQAFPELYRATIAAGEQAGKLGYVLERMAEYLELRQRMWQKIALAMLYPVILTVVSIIIVCVMLGFVIPDIVKVFDNSDQPLPQLTQWLIQLSNAAKVGMLPLLLFMGMLVAAAKRALRNDARRCAVHRKLLRLPVVGKLLLRMETVRFASTLSILTGSGVPLVEAMGISGEVLRNAWLHQIVMRAAERVNEGSSLKYALEEAGVFPPMLLQMIDSGEASGTLPRMLERASANQQKSLEQQVAFTVGLFEPLLLLGMAGIVLILVLAILLPILNLNQLVS